MLSYILSLLPLLVWSDPLDKSNFACKLNETEHRISANENALRICVFEGFPVKSLAMLWTTIEVSLRFDNSDSFYSFYQNRNRTALIDDVERGQGFFGLTKGLIQCHSKYLSPFETSFVTVDTDSPYYIRLLVLKFDYRLFAVFVLGIALFLFSGLLARNVAFYYSTGVCAGLLCSVLILCFLLGRLLPRRSVGVTFMLGGWSLILYALHYLWQNVLDITANYSRLVIAYVVIVSLITFAVMYRMGPPSNRSLDLSQWALQLVGLACIWFGSQIAEVNIAVIVCCIMTYLLPKTGVYRLLRRLWYLRFPAKRKLLTEEEYREEGIRETRKALEKLRQYCRSPNCSPWKTVSRLSSPARFAQFVEGDKDCSDSELRNYEMEDFELPAADTTSSNAWDKNNSSSSIESADNDVEQEDVGSCNSTDDSIDYDEYIASPATTQYRHNASLQWAAFRNLEQSNTPERFAVFNHSAGGEIISEQFEARNRSNGNKKTLPSARLHPTISSTAKVSRHWQPSVSNRGPRMPEQKRLRKL